MVRRLYSNPNDKFRKLRTGRVHMSDLKGMPTSGDMEALKVNSEHAALTESEEDRQRKKHMLELFAAVKIVVASRDKRRRPRGVTKEQFKLMRALKLTRTAKIRKRKVA
jgi:hypothetical protein